MAPRQMLRTSPPSWVGKPGGRPVWRARPRSRRSSQRFRRLPGHALLMVGRDAARQIVDVDGRRIALTRLDKVLYPETGFTKGEMLAYYAEVAAVLVPLAAGRPVTRKRWPDGVGTADEPGQVFLAKNLESDAPDWIPRPRSPGESRGNVYPLLEDRATLPWLAQQATLEVHVPQWRFAADGPPAHPDRLVLDLDPGEGAGLAECAEVARLIRPILTAMGLPTVPVTSGS